MDLPAQLLDRRLAHVLALQRRCLNYVSLAKRMLWAPSG
jgi:hypothetical protein